MNNDRLVVDDDVIAARLRDCSGWGFGGPNRSRSLLVDFVLGLLLGLLRGLLLGENLLGGY